jgi:hypothetical protein
MHVFDKLCAIVIFILAIIDCLLVPRTYTGRIWILGTCLALLFTAMLNLLRIRNARGVKGLNVKGLKMFCITANVTMFTFAVALIASIGRARSLQHPQIPFLGMLLLIETIFSLVTNV